MCTLIVLNRVVPGLPVVLAANRDEFVDRPASAPVVLDEATGIVGGQDLARGGTWMGVTRSGALAAITNQRIFGMPDSSKASRGALVLEVLRAGARGGARAQRAALTAIDPTHYNPFNLLFGDADGVYVAYGRETMTIERVPGGVHVLPNDVLDSPAFPKVERVRAQLLDVPPDWAGARRRLIEVLADDTPPAVLPPEPRSMLPDPLRGAMHAVRVRMPVFATCSSSLVALQAGGVAHYDFADGPPDEVPFVDRLDLLTSAARPNAAIQALSRGRARRPGVETAAAARGSGA